ncbi:MAG: hypothetical protein HY243_11810 [Proteobacteria bacterium]|nr:hypothetical protein [Pseudomonadota bacterium]
MGLLIAMVVGIMAFDHNPQGEFVDTQTGAIQWSAAGPLIGMAFFLPFVGIVLVSGALYFVPRFITRKMSS